MKNRRPPGRQQRACAQFLRKLLLIPRTMGEVDTCRAAGIPENQISRWRQGRPVRLDHAFLLSRQLGASLDWWADDAQEGPPEGASEKMRTILALIRTLGEDAALARLIQAPALPPEPTMEPRAVPRRDKGPSRKPRSQGDNPARQH